MKFVIMCFISIALVLILSLVFIGDSSAIHCRNNSDGIVFSYDPIFNTVDINGYPTYKLSDSWVDFMIVGDDGFIIVYSQETYDPELDDIRAKKHVYRYRADTGFISWHDVLPADISRIQRLDDMPLQQPTSVFDTCDNQTGGGLIQLLAAIKQA